MENLPCCVINLLYNLAQEGKHKIIKFHYQRIIDCVQIILLNSQYKYCTIDPVIHSCLVIDCVLHELAPTCQTLPLSDKHT